MLFKGICSLQELEFIIERSREYQCIPGELRPETGLPSIIVHGYSVKSMFDAISAAGNIFAGSI
jgi:hypothetical protein